MAFLGKSSFDPMRYAQAESQQLAALGQTAAGAVRDLSSIAGQYVDAKQALETGRITAEQAYQAAVQAAESALEPTVGKETAHLMAIQGIQQPGKEHRKNPAGYLEILRMNAQTLQQKAKQLSEQTAAAAEQQRVMELGQEVQRLTSPQAMQTLGQPQTVTPTGESGGFTETPILSESIEPPQAQSPMDIQTQLAAAGYTPQETKPFVETLQKQQETAVAGQREQRLQGQQELAQQREARIARQGRWDYELARARLDQAKKARQAEVASKIVAAVDVPKLESEIEWFEKEKIPEIEKKIEIQKEAGGPTVALDRLKEQLKYYKTKLNEASKVHRDALAAKRVLDEAAGISGGGAAGGVGGGAAPMDAQLQAEAASLRARGKPEEKIAEYIQRRRKMLGSN